jgi:hypothetical protein
MKNAKQGKAEKEPEIKLRWLETTRVYESWDDRSDEWNTNSYVDEPVLQYYDSASKKWKDIPTVRKTKNC